MVESDIHLLELADGIKILWLTQNFLPSSPYSNPRIPIFQAKSELISM